MPHPPKPAKITVGVSGGIAAYRAVELVRQLQAVHLDPHVVMTAAALQFVTPLTFAAISGHRVITTLWPGGEVPQRTDDDDLTIPWSSVEHIEEAQTSQALVCVPATANLLGKLANGIADDFLTTLYTATRAPVIIAPAMNVAMWQHPAIQANVATLRTRGAIIVEPGTGYLACGTQGTGRLAELEAIVEAVQQALVPQRHDLSNETIVVTAGGTREPLDQVRFLGNRSSGRMGYALAAEAARRGARAILISTTRTLPTPPNVELIQVETAAEMQSAVMAALPGTTILLMAAAVADFRPITPSPGKIPRTEALTLALQPTEDIVAAAAAARTPGTTIIAFAAESGPDLTRARAKLHRKHVDAIVMNDISVPGLGFDSDQNAATLILPDRDVTLPTMSKTEMAQSILDEVARMRAT